MYSKCPPICLKIFNMTQLKIHILILIALLSSISVASCSSGPPKPGRDITLKNQGVTLKLAEGWEGEVESTDWTMWRRVQRGTGEEPWVIPPITATKVGAGPQGYDDRSMQWRFKAVKGVFDPTVNPLTSSYPVPPGLWSLDPQKLDLLEDQTQNLPWEGVSDIQATVRLYENTHGYAETSQIWQTLVVTFVVGGNTYEFVFSIPDSADKQEWTNAFWSSIEGLTIEPI
jgi:hypothetical protein